MTNNRPTRFKATMLVGNFCVYHKCKKMIEKCTSEGTFRICGERKSNSCVFLIGGCSICGDYSDFSSLVIHHKNCDGDILEGEHRSNFHNKIVLGDRKIDDLIVLCKKCHNDGFILNYLCELFSFEEFSNCYFNYYSHAFQKIGYNIATVLIYRERWQGTTFTKKPKFQFTGPINMRLENKI